MSAALHAVEKVCRHIGGGLKRIVLIDPRDVASITPYYLLPNIQAVVFLPGKSALAFNFDRRAASLKDSTGTDDPAGDVIDYRLSARVKNFRLQVQYLRAKLLNRRIHVAATYQDGTQVFLKNIRLSAGHSSGDRYSDLNAYTFTGALRLAKPAPTIETVLIGGGGGTTPDPTPGPGAGGVQTDVIETSADSYEYTVPAGCLLAAIYLIGDNNQTVSIGLADGDSDLNGAPIDLLANQPYLLGSNLLRPGVDTSIFFSGLAGTNTIEIWLLKAPS